MTDIVHPEMNMFMFLMIQKIMNKFDSHNIEGWAPFKEDPTDQESSLYRQDASYLGERSHS
jgi:hypothetical protein